MYEENKTKQIEIVNLKKPTHAIIELRIFVVLKYQTGIIVQSERVNSVCIIYKLVLLMTVVDIQV